VRRLRESYGNVGSAQNPDTGQRIGWKINFFKEKVFL
jgi:hypothetical protein